MGMTECHTPDVPGRRAGLRLHGRVDRAEAIAEFRGYYEHQLAEAQKALAVADEDLVVVTYRGNGPRQDVTQ